MTNSSANTSKLRLFTECSDKTIESIELQHERVTKASFAKCPISDRKLFSKSKCILPISIMHRKEHDDKRFAATMKLVESSFEGSALLIIDSLYRHTLKLDYPYETETTLSNMAITAGDEWLSANKDAYHKLSERNVCKIIRWNECLSQTMFSQQNKTINDLYNNDQSFKESINSTAEEYLCRQRKANGKLSYDYNHAFTCSVNFIKEECAAMCLYSTSTLGQYEFEVYPTGRPAALAATYEKLIKPLCPNFLRPVGIRFKKYQ